jgi:hypothetical protein
MRFALDKPTSESRRRVPVDDRQPRGGNRERGGGHGKAEVARHGDVAAATHAEAVDRRDGRLRRSGDRIAAAFIGVLVFERLRGVGAYLTELGDIGAGAEARAVAGQDDRADIASLS